MKKGPAVFHDDPTNSLCWQVKKRNGRAGPAAQQQTRTLIDFSDEKRPNVSGQIQVFPRSCRRQRPKEMSGRGARWTRLSIAAWMEGYAPVNLLASVLSFLSQDQHCPPAPLLRSYRERRVSN